MIDNSALLVQATALRWVSYEATDKMLIRTIHTLDHLDSSLSCYYMSLWPWISGLSSICFYVFICKKGHNYLSVFIPADNKLPQTQWLKQYKHIMLQFWKSEVLSGSHWAKIKAFLEALRKIHFFDFSSLWKPFTSRCSPPLPPSSKAAKSFSPCIALISSAFLFCFKTPLWLDWARLDNWG